MKSALLNINGAVKNATQITYDDLVILYTQFIEKYGHVPTTAEGLSKYNLPQGRIVKKILEKNNITNNDFLNQFGKVSHVRTESKDYTYFLERYKEICQKLGFTLRIKDLTNNEYGLPSADWFVKYCPDKDIKTYSQFVNWVGFQPNSSKQDKFQVSIALKEMEKKLNRPIKQTDITTNNIGFSMIVINRIWGSLKKCKEELGLMETLPNQPKSFKYYSKLLDQILENIMQNTPRRIISWKDIENNNFSHTDHKTFTKAFKRENIDIFEYIKSKGFDMNPSNFSFHYTFHDGERVLSTMEYDFSLYLRKIGYKYKKDYRRDVYYKDFVFMEKSSRINCDYVINNNKYIEIAGIISNPNNNNWETYSYSSKQENKYRHKMLKKKELLELNNIDYLFLFSNDFVNNEYQIKLNDFLNSN